MKTMISIAAKVARSSQVATESINSVSNCVAA